MVGSTASVSRTLGLFPKDGTQAPTNESIQPLKGEGMRLLEAAEPAP
jgi:hypothetical protein